MSYQREFNQRDDHLITVLIDSLNDTIIIAGLIHHGLELRLAIVDQS